MRGGRSPFGLSVGVMTGTCGAGADGALVITPYYNKPTPEGQYRHYKSIAEELTRRLRRTNEEVKKAILWAIDGWTYLT